MNTKVWNDDFAYLTTTITNIIFRVFEYI